jgi:hypothetical protein
MTLYATHEAAQAEATRRTHETGVKHFPCECAMDDRFTVIAEQCDCMRGQKLPKFMKCYKCMVDAHKKRGDKTIGRRC